MSAQTHTLCSGLSSGVNQLAVYGVGINASIILSFPLIAAESHFTGLLD
jgi:hypothetical protein